MSGGVVFDAPGGLLEFSDPPRVVYSTDGALFNVLPTMRSFQDRSVVYSDFSKTDVFLWTHNVVSAFDHYERGESCRTWIAAVPQRTVHKTVLEAAPDGADAFVGRVRISRVSGPLSTWMTRTIPVLPKLDQWLAWNGSCEIEKEIGMTRLLHVYIDDNQDLVIEDEQSVSVGTNGVASGSHGANPSSVSTGSGGIELLTGTGAEALIIAVRDAKSRGYDQVGAIGASFGASYGASGASSSMYRRNGTNPCSRADTTSYTSSYLVDVEGFYARRS